MRFADIIVNISLEKLDRSYQYRIPPELKESVQIGSSVTIPFGKGGRTLDGYVVGLSDEPAISEDRIKDILSVNVKDLRIEDRMIALACHIRENYGGTLNEALRTVMPVKREVKKKSSRDIVVTADDSVLYDELELSRKRNHHAKARLLEELISERTLDLDVVVNNLLVSRQTVDSIARKGLAEIRVRTMYRNPHFEKSSSGSRVPLNDLQRSIADDMISDLRNMQRKDYLLHGVTGSGKTEVYMEVMEEVIKLGKQVIMLIPEIALTYQTVTRLYRRFGERISILNSRMSAGERFDQSERARNGDIDIMIGPRSALFTPFERLGLIIIDEEHEESYKNEGVPHYNAREVALYRGRTEGASVLLGSATPSVETYEKTERGLMKLYRLDKRAGLGAFPEVHVVDMREELKNKNRTIFSVKLRELIQDRLAKGEQTMIFLNRRGYSGFVSCRSCGKVVKCPHCDISLTKHYNGRMVCHYCGYEQDGISTCPSCGSRYVGSFGIGTEKIEEQLRQTFPEARILRMDADTTKGKNGHEDILSSFKNGEADILVGTQMIVKGHDFHRVTLVGILAADMSLSAPDFRASERTFDLITQASGRAGRGALSGEVVIQTYQPENSCIQAAAAGDYDAFYSEEIAYRRLLGYPPAKNLLLVLCCTPKEEQAKPFGEYVAERIRRTMRELHADGQVRMIGPAEANLAKANDIFRQAIYLKAEDYSVLVAIKNRIMDINTEDRTYPGASIQFDFNPQRGY